MEIRKDDQSIRFEFQSEDTLYVEWCDGQVRGMREMDLPGYRKQIKRMMHSVLKEENSCICCAAQGKHLHVEAAHGNGYFTVELAYVPEEDLLPWQWIRVKDYFRQPEYRDLMESL